MSTKGKFIIRKGNTDKELAIGHDAFPDVAGMEIVELLKTTDMDRLFALIDDYHTATFDEAFDDPGFPDEPELFDYLTIKRAIRDGKTIYGTVYDEPVTAGTIFSEYVYVVDLDHAVLLFLVDGTPKNMDFSRMELGHLPKYPFVLKATLDLEYVRRVRASLTVDTMNAAAKSDKPSTYTFADIGPEDEIREDYSLQKQMSAELMQTILERLAALRDKILSADFINERRADKTVYRCSDVLSKIKETEEYIDLLGPV